MQRELELLQKLALNPSENIVSPWAVVMAGKVLDSMIFEFCEETLSARWKRHNRILPPEFTVELVRDMVCGLMHLHSMCVAHRDLKMDNMMLQVGAGGRVRLKLCDYGWCKPMTYESSLATPVFAQCYRAPEIVL